MQKYTQNLKILDEWSPELAYIIGLALTDGNINKPPGIELLDKRTGKMFTGKKQMYGFFIDSMQAARRFCELGVKPNKSYTGEYPIVPQDVWWHYFRGILDGDGNINFSRKTGLRISIAGNRNCVLGLQLDLAELFSIRSRIEYLDEDRCKYLVLRGENAERALILTYQDSENLRLERKYNQGIDWNENHKLVRSCLLCDIPIRSPNNQKLCPPCRGIRQRLMNRRSDHYKRNGTWLSLRELCKPEESHLRIENLDRYLE